VKTLLRTMLFLALSSAVIAQAAPYDCGAKFPNPLLKYGSKDAAGRVYISVQNAASYSNDLFKPAPELPPCGQNANSSRTWVDIYNAANNARMYGVCAPGTNSLLTKLWFMPPTPHGKAYIVINDRGCKKLYKSNMIAW